MTTDFNEYGSDYRHVHDLNIKKIGFASSYFAERKVREIARHIQHGGNCLRILDLGCGDGECLHYFKKYYPGSDLYGIDVSENSIRSGIQRHQQIPFILYDGQKIPFDKASFDIILVANVLHHVSAVSSRKALLKECRRTLKRHGKIFIFEHNPLNPLTRRIVAACPFDVNVKLISHISMQRMLRMQAFKCKCRFIIFTPGILKAHDHLENYLNWFPLGGQYYITAEK